MALLTNDIYIGSVSTPLYHFTNANAELSGFKGNFALDVIGNELSVDQFTANIHWTEDDMFDGFITVDNEKLITSVDEDFLVLTHVGASTELRDFLKELPYGTPIWWYVAGSFYSKGYLKSVDRVSRNGFKLTCVSGVGLLDTDMHSGGLYQATAITDVLANIIGGAFTYSVSQAVQNTARVYGRLPYDTRRNNLHRLLFASGAALQKGNSSTDYIIDYLSESVTDVTASRVALQGSVDYQLPSNRAEITEHSFFYLSSSPTETLFDNTSETPAEGLTVIFEAPVYVASLATTGTLTVDEAGVNYAVVSGLGTLTGQYYVHTTQIDVLENNPNNDPIRVRRVTENELITALNARNVQRRVLSYYQSAKTVKAKILIDGERCGQLIRMTDAFGEITQAYLAKMDTLVTSVVGAQCQLIEGYQPGNGGNNFLHRQAITANGNFTIPAGVTFIRVALIGGAQGGQGGYDGEEGAYKRKGTDPIWDPGEPGGELTSEYTTIVEDYLWMYYMGYANGDQRIPAGGNPGASGQQAKVYVVERAVTPGEVISFIVGSGGAGGTRNGGIGALGTPTTASSTSLGFVSSENGLASQGYFDPMSGDAYATPGVDGIKGGDGGRVDTISLVGNRGGNGLPGENAGVYSGGAGGAGIIRNLTDYGYTEESKVSGGGGGGGAYGANGSPGGNATFVPADGHGVGDRLTSGAGGDGANALPPPKPTYGCGGGGGNGGGAGGNCGGVAGLDGYYLGDVATVYKHQGGAAGKGSVGGAGGDGLVVIYW